MPRAPRTGGWGVVALRVAVLAASLAAAGCAAPAGGPGAPRASGAGPLREATGASPSMPVGHAGRWLVDATGRVLLLHGVNEVVKGPPWDPARLGFDDADAAWLAANGFDFVRLGVEPAAALPAPGSLDTAYLGELLAVARDLGRHDVLTLLDVHQDGYGDAFPGNDGFPAWMTRTDGSPVVPAPFPHEYDDPAVQAAFAALWRDEPGPGGTGLQEDATTLLGALARTFGGLPTLLGYDVLNEPWPGTDATPCGRAGGCPGQEAASLVPFDAKADRALRAADRTHLVLVEPFVQFSDGEVPVTLPLPAGDRNSGLSFHAYSTGATAHALAWARRTGGALLATEWGASPDPGVLAGAAQSLDLALVPWAYWAYDDCCSTPVPADSLVRTRRGVPSGADANAPVLGEVLRPHPLAVAGTPEALTYDPAGRVLRFTWDADAVAGGSFDGKSVTSLEVPAALYPTGYTVTASGAVVTSAPCAPLLTVHLARHVRRASLLVAPGGGCPSAHGGP